MLENTASGCAYYLLAKVTTYYLLLTTYYLVWVLLQGASLSLGRSGAFDSR